MFTYYLGSDTFHQALKYGIFADTPLFKYLIIIAGLGLLTYIVCAIVFTKKHKHKNEEKSLAKGVMLKRSVQLYTFVLAVFLGLTFMLMISFQLNTFWGSRVLIIVMAFNLIVPVIAISLISPNSLRKQIGNPSETDRFMMKKGG